VRTVEQNMNCEICKTENPSWAWTDTHGVAQCWKCGTPYRLYHYEGEGEATKRVEKPPELCVKAEYVPVLQAYWNENQRIIPSGFSFPGGQELASRSDSEAFSAWMKENAEKHKAPNGGHELPRREQP
jgi:hypothetical protein